MAKKMKTLDIVAIVLLIVGGLNWGLVGAFNFNLVDFIFGNMVMVKDIVYGLVGLSAVYSVFTLSKL